MAARPSPLQNRVFPDGTIVASTARGTMMGNRGILHDEDSKKLRNGVSWKHRAWICCVLDFKNRQRTIMKSGHYTELFFLDEVTAFASGHRPCFECRREQANLFATLWRADDGGAKRINGRAAATDMDRQLQSERVSNGRFQTHQRSIDSLPIGAMYRDGDAFVAVGNKHHIRWTENGYTSHTRNLVYDQQVEVFTPPSIVDVLARGYVCSWHPSADGLM